MPERLDRVQVLLSRGVVVVPFDSRDWLIGELEHVDGGAAAIRAFRGAGASVQLKRDGKVLLVQAIDAAVARNVEADGLPPGVWDLRNALFDDLHDVQA